MPYLGIRSMLFAIASKEDQMSNYVSRSLFISTELPLVSKFLTSVNSSCFSWSKQSRLVQVQVLVADCGHPRKRTADKDPSCPLIESGTSAPSPETNLGRHAKVFILRDYVTVSTWQVIRGFPWQSGETRSWLTTDIDVSLADSASD